MLVITRRNSESIIITTTATVPAGTTLEVMLCEASQTKTRIGIEADKSLFHVLRSELVEASMGDALLRQQRHDAESATDTDSNG